MSDKFMIYSIHHSGENYPAYQNDVVTPIHAGIRPSNPRKDISIYDDLGDNISYKNDLYGEFTATYWVWKNADADYVGIMHYRRALNFNAQGYPSGENFCQCHGLTRKHLEMVFADVDIVTGEPMYLDEKNIYEQYKKHHLFPEDVFNEIQNYISKEYPEMLNTYKSHFYGTRQPAYFKCQIMAKREIYDEYMKFIFGTLGYLEKNFEQRLRNSSYDATRFYAFIGERLMSLFIKHCIVSNRKIKFYPISYYENEKRYIDYKTELFDTYEMLMKTEPAGYLRHLFYHRNILNELDQRVSLNINFIDHISDEYSVIMKNGKFEEFILNTHHHIKSLDMLPIICENKKYTIGLNKYGFIINDKNKTEMKFRYMTSGSKLHYDAYFTYWNEPDYNYNPKDISLCNKVIFVFRKLKTDNCSVSSRLYVMDMSNTQKTLLYLEAQRNTTGNVFELDICHVSNSAKIPDKHTYKKAICCLDGEGRRIELALSEKGFHIDGKAPVLTVQLQDWEGNISEVSAATWFYYDAEL